MNIAVNPNHKLRNCQLSTIHCQMFQVNFLVRRYQMVNWRLELSAATHLTTFNSVCDI